QLFRQVLLGEITPQRLVLMSPTELASLELMEWRKRENKHLRRFHLRRCPAASKRFRPRAHAVWKGFMQMSNMKRFLVKAYPVLGHTDYLTK
ncbi:hypothetical protein scyTo_0019411, partial [Scyliorhinus torazame]|nr:hypothetical protein [Scyliorhinus torazame]